MKPFGIPLTTLVLTLALTLISYCTTYKNQELKHSDFCMQSLCIENFEKIFSGSIKIFRSGMYITTALTIILTSYIALKNYKISVQMSSLSSYVGHSNLFKDFLESEIEKRNQLKLSNVNIHYWYRHMFPNAKNGELATSEEYKITIKGITSSIIKTNNSINTPKGGYGYRKHQDRMVLAFKKLGIKIGPLPKNDFNLIETQIFDLIDTVNLTFTDIREEISAHKRDYK
jgi:hypothetical protein